jgi:hypothetical protein
VPFPVSISGEVPLPSDDVEGACDRVIEQLEVQKAETTLRWEDKISLSVPLFRGWRWNFDLVAMLDRVDLTIVDTRNGPALRYRLSLMRMAILGVAFSLSVAIAGVMEGLPAPVAAVVSVFFLIMVPNYLYTLARAKSFFRKHVRSTGVQEVG